MVAVELSSVAGSRSFAVLGSPAGPLRARLVAIDEGTTTQ